MPFREMRDAIEDEAQEFFRATGGSGGGWFGANLLKAFLQRIGPVLEAAQLYIVAGAYRHPMPGRDLTKKVTTASSSVVSGYAAELHLVSPPAAVALTVMAELIEFYAAASVRADAYARAGRDPGPSRVAEDLADVLGTRVPMARGEGRHVAQEALTVLVNWIGNQVVRDFFWHVVLVVGPIVEGVSSWRVIARVQAAPLPVRTDEERAGGPRGDIWGSLPSFERVLKHYRSGLELPRELGWS